MAVSYHQNAKLQSRGGDSVPPSFRYGLNIQASWRPDERVWKRSLHFPRLEVQGGDSAMQLAPFEMLARRHPLRDQFRQSWMTGFRGERRHALLELFGSTPVATGQLIVIPKKIVAAEPVRLRCPSLGQGLHVTHVLVIVEEGASVQLVEEKMPNMKKNPSLGSENVWINVVEVIAHPRSSIHWIADAHTPSDLHSIAFRRAALQREACLNMVVLGKEGRAQKWDTKIDLRGLRSNVDLRQAIVADGSREFDCSARILHHAPETTSRSWTKAVLSDHAKVIARGWVSGKRGAVRMKGEQREDALLLDQGVEFDPIPNLEIDQNEVECSHGVTVSRIDEDLLFYLQSRGVDDRRARSEIVKGFLRPVLQRDFSEFSDPIRRRLDDFINTWK